MPKVGHTTIFDYKNRITDLESEVTTLKRRLDELRRAKVQAFYKQSVSVRRSSKADISVVEQVEQVEQVEDPAVSCSSTVSCLTQTITRLQKELELAELKYSRETSALSLTIEELQEEVYSVKGQIDRLNDKHYTAFEMLKRSHTEELALYSEKWEREREGRSVAERELSDYKLKRRSATLQLPDVEVLKKELARLQAAYHSLREEREQEVRVLEERIVHLLAQIAEKSKRRFQLIPDRTYIVKKSTASSSSVGSISECVDLSKSVHCKAGRSEVEPSSSSSAAAAAAVPSTRVETIDRPKSTITIRPKSSVTMVTSVRPKSSVTARTTLARPKSCWSDRREGAGRSNKQKYANVSSRIDTGRGMEAARGECTLPSHSGPNTSRHSLLKYKPARNGSLGSSVSPWQAPSIGPKGNRSYVARSNYL